MVKLKEIEAAADALPPEQKQELFLFLIARLRADGGPLRSLRPASPRLIYRTDDALTRII